MSTALKNFQRFFGLAITGEVDDATIKQMAKPRCGVPDDVVGQRFKRYTLFGTSWGKTDLTYYVQYGADLSHEAQDRIFRDAFRKWSDVTPLTFTRSSQTSSDVKIR